ncbi:flippase [Nocardioides sp. C4-1]|uniref:flippase n=1 Tax=Nocardioides sp. C4-1 TaxID=3151851 RepID=UPI003263B2FE
MLRRPATEEATDQVPDRAPDDALGEHHDDQGHRALLNTSWLIGSRLGQAVLGWGGTLLIARTLSIEDFGRFTLIFTILGLMSVVTDMGIGRIAVRGMLGELEGDDGQPLAGGDAAHFAGAYLLLRTLLGVVGYVLVIVIVLALGHPRVAVGAAVAGVVVLLATPSSALDVVFQARLRMGGVSVLGVVGLAAQFALTAALAAAGGTLLLFCIPAVLCQVVILAWKIPAAHRLVPIRLRVDRALWWRMLREALPLTVGLGLATIYYRVDAIMLSQLDDFDAVGIYGVSYKFIDIVQSVAVAVTVPLLTVLVTTWPGDLAGFRAAVRRSTMLLGLLGGTAIVGLVGFAEPLTSVLYGEHYAVGANATKVLAVAIGLALLTSLAITCLVAIERHRGYPLVMLAGLVLNLGLNIALIPAYSYRGAAVATLISEVVVLTMLCVLLLRVRELRPWGLGRFLVVPVAIGAGVGVGIGADLVLPWVLAATLAVAAFLGAATAGGVLAASGVSGSLRKVRS